MSNENQSVCGLTGRHTSKELRSSLGVVERRFLPLIPHKIKTRVILGDRSSSLPRQRRKGPKTLQRYSKTRFFFSFACILYTAPSPSPCFALWIRNVNLLLVARKKGKNKQTVLKKITRKKCQAQPQRWDDLTI